jgi:DNA polymerase-1
MVSFEELVGKGKQARHITEVPLESVAVYSAEDADMTYRIRERQIPRLREMNLMGLCDEIEFPLIGYAGEDGIRRDRAGRPLPGGDVEGPRAPDREPHHGYSPAGGRKFNINSTRQLGGILFNTLKLPTVRKTKTGFSTDVGVLETLRGMHPIIDNLLNYRQLTKLKSTYIDALPSLINPVTGRVHTSFNQTVAATGRLSSSDPNLQNIPIRTEIGRSIRKAFIPRSPGSVLMSADYSQIELRVMAHMSADESLIAAFRNDEDIHATTASRVFGVPATGVSPDMRRKAKEVNFGIIYGIGPFGLGNRLEITQSEAKEIIARYFERFPKVKQYINDTIAGARRDGYVATLTGRRRYLPDINSRNMNIRGNAERQAINMPIQGTAADMIKIAMIRLDGSICAMKMKSRMLLQVHDELVFEVPREEEEKMTALVTGRDAGCDDTLPSRSRSISGRERTGWRRTDSAARGKIPYSRRRAGQRGFRSRAARRAQALRATICSRPAPPPTSPTPRAPSRGLLPPRSENMQPGPGDTSRGATRGTRGATPRRRQGTARRP